MNPPSSSGSSSSQSSPKIPHGPPVGSPPRSVYFSNAYAPFPFPELLPPGAHNPEVEPEFTVPAEPFGSRPLSPLAWKYGLPDYLDTTTTPERLFEGTLHSLLGTNHPDPGDTRSDIPKPSNAELDKLFVYETTQHRDLYGLKSWQLPFLNLKLYGGWPIPDGVTRSPWEEWHIYKKSLAIINYDQWLTCFGRENWYDLRTNMAETIQDPIPGLLADAQIPPFPDKTFWTVDNPHIWEVMALVMELTNRIYMQLCVEQNGWLDSIMKTSSWKYNGHESQFLFSKNVSLDRVATFVDHPLDQRRSAQELWQDLEDLTSRKITWAFFDESTTVGNCYGSTHAGLGGVHATIKVPVNYMRPLLERGTPVLERCHALVTLVSTVMHEFAHAINFCLYPVDCWDQEPFYNNEFVRELGFCIEKIVFGSITNSCPNERYTEGLHRGYVTHFGMAGWPHPKRHSRKWDHELNGVNRWLADPDNRWDYPIGGYFASAFLCEKFWTDIVARRGIEGLKFPRLFCTKEPSAFQFHVSECNEPDTYLDEFTDEYKEALDAWRAGENAMASRREWYYDECSKWWDLPWHHLQLRTSILRFTYFHATRNLNGCRRILVLLLTNVLDVSPALVNIVPEDVSSLYENIILLMAASIPLFPFGTFEVDRVAKWHSMWPSQAMVKGWWGKNQPTALRPDPHPAAGPWIEQTKVGNPKMTSFTLRSRTAMLKRMKDNWKISEFKFGGPMVWLRAVHDAMVHLQGQLSGSVSPDQWLDFEFRIPPYEPNWVTSHKFREEYTITPIHLRYRLNTPDELNIYFPPGNSGFVPAKVSGYKDPNTKLRYKYPGQVADHFSHNDAWIVMRDDTGLDIRVYDVTGLLQDLKIDTDEKHHEIIRYGPHGPELVDDHPNTEAIRSALGTSIQPNYLVMILRRPEEVAEQDGTNGKRSWVSWGDSIYDVTNFPFKHDTERLRFRRCAGGPIHTELISTWRRAGHLEGRLVDYRCAHLKVQSWDRRANLRYFTPWTLRLHDNPDTGLYIGIHGRVYDFSSYSFFHPGGFEMLHNCWGTDATSVFDQYHKIEELDNWTHMEIGRLVPEIRLEDMQPNQVTVHNWVFDISSLQQQDPPLYNILYPYIQQDTYYAVLNIYASPSVALANLYLSRKDLIVASLPQTKYHINIARNEFNLHTGENKYDRGIWTEYAGYAWNITELTRYPELYPVKVDANWGGKLLTDSVIGDWLILNHGPRCVGKILEGAWPVWNPKADLDFAATPAPPYQIKSLKRKRGT